MKNQFIITVAFLAFTSFSSQLFAQQSGALDGDLDVAKDKGGISCNVISTDQGCSLSFTKIETAEKDVAGGQATGKRMHKPLSVTVEVDASDNSVQEVKSPRDAASGLATGRRQHQPLVVTKELDKSSPLLSKTIRDKGVSNGGGAGKVSVQDFHFIMKGNGKSTIIRCPDGSCVIPTNYPDGQYTLACDWSWGMSQVESKASAKRCAVDFLIDIENGACVAINQKGSSSSSK